MGKIIPNVEPIVDDAMRYLDAELRREYDIACQHAGDVVARESVKARFLRAEDNNPWRAARRLALYWKFRRQAMTAEHWLKPITGKGSEGCLGGDHVTLLRRGYCDYFNRKDTGPMLVMDLCRRQGVEVEEDRGVCIFLGTMIDDEEIQTRGVTVVFVVNSNAKDMTIGLKAATCVKEGLPVKVTRFVVVQDYEPHKEALLEFFAGRTQLELQANYTSIPCEVISSCESRQDLLKRAEYAGIPRDALPESCGGGRAVNPFCHPFLHHLFHPPSPTLQLLLPRFPGSGEDKVGAVASKIPNCCLKGPSTRGNRKRTNEDVIVSTSSESTVTTLSTTSTRPYANDAVAVRCGCPQTIDEMLSEVRQAMKRCRRTVATQPQVAAVDSLLGNVSGVATQTQCFVDSLLGETRQASSSEAPFAVEENFDFGFPVADPWESTFN